MDNIDAQNRQTERRYWVEIWISVIVAIATESATILAFYALDVSRQANRVGEEARLTAERANELSEEANATAEKARADAREAIERDTQIYEQQIARKVSLEEKPSGFKTLDSESHYVIINKSDTAINNTWVEGTIDNKPAQIKIWQIPSCTLYTLPKEFNPAQVHFTDGNYHWTREAGGKLILRLTDFFPENDDGESPRDARYENCH